MKDDLNITIEMLKQETDICDEGIEFFEREYPNGFNRKTFEVSKKIMSPSHMYWFLKKFFTKDDAPYWCEVIKKNFNIFDIKFIIKISKLDGFNESDELLRAFQVKKPSYLDWVMFFKNSKLLTEHYIEMLIKADKASNIMFNAFKTLLVMDNGKRNGHNIEKLKRSTAIGKLKSIFLSNKISIHNSNTVENFLFLSDYLNWNDFPQYNVDILSKVDDFIISQRNNEYLIKLCRKYDLCKRDSLYGALINNIASKDELDSIESILINSNPKEYENFIIYIKNKQIRG